MATRTVQVTCPCCTSMFDTEVEDVDAGLLDALKAWQRFDSEAQDQNPCPDLALRRHHRIKARELTHAAIARAEGR